MCEGGGNSSTPATNLGGQTFLTTSIDEIRRFLRLRITVDLVSGRPDTDNGGSDPLHSRSGNSPTHNQEAAGDRLSDGRGGRSCGPGVSIARRTLIAGWRG